MLGEKMAGSSWARKVQNFSARSYRFAGVIRVFHVRRGEFNVIPKLSA
jgi:hypothetical protein